jgi:hypothetical protein
MIWHVDTVRAQRSQNGWICTVDDSVGYVYNTEQQAWKSAAFNPGANFIVRPPREEDIKVFPESLGQAYVVLQLIGAANIYVTTCPYIPDLDGLMVCQREREPLQIFSINARQLRMESYYSGSYLVDQNDPNSSGAAGSSIAIGRCHSL